MTKKLCIKARVLACHLVPCLSDALGVVVIKNWLATHEQLIIIRQFEATLKLGHFRTK